MSGSRRWVLGVLAMMAVWMLPQWGSEAARVNAVTDTKHNLSATGPGTVKASSESQICVFCHTPHAAENLAGQPLWNRKLSGATYTPYSSSSIDANVAELANGPGGASKLCLSCHDGTMALGNVNVLNGQANPTIAMMPGMDKMPSTGATTGFTRNLGTNLTNDHPISFTYDAGLASRDGELRTPGGVGVPVANRVAGGVKPKLPLAGDQLQCTACHDPHVKETDEVSNGPGKFLRLNRFQTNAAPTGLTFNEQNDQICLGCHDKDGIGWAYSVHANDLVANETYKADAASLREFPVGLPVWRAGCLNCHDTHTVEGSRRLLREGTDSMTTPKSGGGRPAIEQTCYQCHQNSAARVLNTNTPDEVPDVRTDFESTYRMPITALDQGRDTEVHDIGTSSTGQPVVKRGADFVESQRLLGKGDLSNRHVECTDCHNPHRVVKNRLFNANPATPDNAGTHLHAAGHTNLASGVLKGTTGVEPMGWSGAAFGSTVTGWRYLSGNPAIGASTDKTLMSTTWVTREYQVCLKCHSNYAYDSAPDLKPGGSGGTPVGTNGLQTYTDQSMEFQAPAGHVGHPPSTSDGGASSTYSTNNGRSWHPVMEATGRTAAIRGSNAANGWRAPWNGASLGIQTMYCSDCHGSAVASRTDVLPDGNTGLDTPSGESGRAWGPHGSTNPFILKGEWSTSGNTHNGDTLCLRCHNPTNSSNFNGGGKGNLHDFHVKRIGRIRCHWCHVAVPHGWKNRSFLVNLNDVGPEAGLAVGTTIDQRSLPYNKAPYYMNAYLKIRSMPGRSSGWQDTNCGTMSNDDKQYGKDWMKSTCENPP